MRDGHARCIRLDGQEGWEHHAGGWKDVIEAVRDNLHCADGIKFLGSVEDEMFAGHVIAEPWVGFLHQVPRHNLKWFPDLERLLRLDTWIASAKNCLGLFVLSTVLKDYLLAECPEIPVARVPYPFTPTTSRFDFRTYNQQSERRLLFVGEYLRNYQAFFDLEAPGYRKYLLLPSNARLDHVRDTGSVLRLPRVSDEEYDALVARSVLFLNLYDAPANTTVLECIARGTPLLINRLPGVVEYLGNDYPLFYESLDEASALLSDSARLEAAVAHLAEIREGGTLSRETFVDAVVESAIYRSLPVPSTQQRFRTYDVSLLICSYKRLDNIAVILEALCQQTYDGTFEVIIWNNNKDTQDALEHICARFRDVLDITLIQSSFNYYCVVRLAAASLVRSPDILICDDDVIPSTHYVARFMSKRREYGPEAVLCIRGHVFLPHDMDEENPGRIWTDYEHIRFFDEGVDDRQVHFFHADNCLISTKVMQAAASVPIPRLDFWLIDDYWMSYVFGAILHIPVWKIRADDVARFTPSAEDASVALFLNPHVQAERVNMYVHHMRAGWPYSLRRASAKKVDVPATTVEWDVDARFAGVNMFSEATRQDFRDVRQAGVKVIRIGAVNDATDLRYLVDATGDNICISDETVSRLATSIEMAAEHGLKVVLTLTHVPGRLFSVADEYDLRMWASVEHRMRIVKLWDTLAHYFASHRNVVAFDLLNEPFTPLDTTRSSKELGPDPCIDMLNAIYADCLTAIRRHSTTLKVIFESTHWANPQRVSQLKLVDDSNVMYSCHMYQPVALTNRAHNKQRYCYPGPVRQSPDSTEGGILVWDKATLRNYLSPIEVWRKEMGLSSSQIFIGEFGICRETVGAQQYLTDLMDIFDEFRWSWCLYAFRDEAWDAMDYELGPSLDQMFRVEGGHMFDVISRRLAKSTERR